MWRRRNTISAKRPSSGGGAAKQKAPFISGRQRSKAVLVLHESESAPDHGVLKIGGRFHSRDFTCEVLPHAQVFRPPGNTLSHTDQFRRDPGPNHNRLPVMLTSGKMYFHTSREIKASLNWQP
jgi:hypothetical protein